MSAAELVNRTKIERIARAFRSVWRKRPVVGSVLLALSLVVARGATLPTLSPVPADQPFSFAVLGDNRGYSSGEQLETFREIVQAVNEVRPAFVLNTGDMVYGLGADPAALRQQWRRYFDVVSQLRTPIFHVPGNHDILDSASAAIYKELCGPVWYTFTYAGTRFIGLDTESIPGRLGHDQLQWLENQLQTAPERNVFIFLHEPLFPTGPAAGMSLDRVPAERDKLHALFVRHRDRIKAVFEGHEHLYNYEERDGISYYITGGAGADLYEPGELGGFHHYLLVRVEGEQASVELRKVGPSSRSLRPPRKIVPGTLLESWESGLFWQTWNYTVTAELTPERASDGTSGLRVNFDLAQCGWPTLVLPLNPAWDAQTVEAALIDVFVPTDLKQKLTLTPALETKTKFELPLIDLKPGWNTIRTDLKRTPVEFQRGIQTLDWTITSSDRQVRSELIFDNFRAERNLPGSAVAVVEPLESWERPLFWRAADESVGAGITTQGATADRHSAKLEFDFARSSRPVLLARLNPPWDLSAVHALSVDIFVPQGLEELSVSLGLRTRETAHETKPMQLRPGWNHMQPELNASWLPPSARTAAEQVEWTLFSTNQTLRSWVLFDNLRAR